MYRNENRSDKQPSFLPFFGFILILIISIIAWFFSPRAIVWLETTKFPATPPYILPLVFPPQWSLMVSRLVVTLFVFAVFFMIFVIVWLVFSRTDRDKEQYGEYGEYVRTGKVSSKLKNKKR